MDDDDAREGMGGEMGKREEIEARLEAVLDDAYNDRLHTEFVDSILTELARVEAERDAAVAKVAAGRAECALLRRLVVMPGPDGVATHDYAADRIEAALDAPATEEE